MHVVGRARTGQRSGAAGRGRDAGSPAGSAPRPLTLKYGTRAGGGGRAARVQSTSTSDAAVRESGRGRWLQLMVERRWPMRRHAQVSALEVQQQWFASRCYTSAVRSIPHWFARYDMGTASWLAVVYGSGWESCCFRSHAQAFDEGDWPHPYGTP